MIESPLLEHVQGFINGDWAQAQSGQTLAVINPATGETLSKVPLMGHDETRLAVESAQSALAQPAPIEQRRQWLNQVADLHIEHKKELGRIITLENGKPWKEAQAEAEYAAGFYRYCATHIEKLKTRHLQEQPKNHTWTVHHRPAGVVGLITPWNFPLAMIAKKLSAALAADCPSVIKPAEKTPLSMVALFSLLDQVGLAAGKVNLVMGHADQIGRVLCEHPAVRTISFTGSTRVGRLLIAATAPHVKKLSLELGGNAPFVVFDDADLDRAAEHLIQNKFRGAGQTCVCTNRVYIQRSAAAAFIEKVAARVSGLKVGNGMEDGVDIGPLIDRGAVQRVATLVDDALTQGATRVAGKAWSAADDGCFFPPTVLRGVTDEMPCTREEIFGPVLPVIEFEDEQDAVRRSNGTEYGLAAYVFTADPKRAERVAGMLQFGHVGLNTGAGPTPEAPFGGMKQSGFGREGGTEGLFEFTEPQAIACA